MTKFELQFTIEYGVKEMEFYCGDDACFEARFKDENGETFEFKASRQKVMEHVEKYAKHPEEYLTNKKLVVAHFHRWAIAWYKKTHLPKSLAKELQEQGQMADIV